MIHASIEGNLFSRDFLSRLVAAQSELPHTAPTSYGLGTQRTREAIAASWNVLAARFERFQGELEKLAPNDPATAATRREWLLPLLEELGFGRVQSAPALETSEKSYAISHGWNGTPLHLLGARVALDKRTPNIAGAAQQAPHALLQEALNRSDGLLWGVVSNGLRLRLLRDSLSIARLSFVEFDLEAIFTTENLASFGALWLLCHASRFENGGAILEAWVQASREDGTRALDRLRDATQGAIEILGGGFLRHPNNLALRKDLEAGALSNLDFYKYTLRIVYRMLFVLVAEAKDALLLPVLDADDPGKDARDEARALYGKFFALSKLKDRARKRRGDDHLDLWRGLRILFSAMRCGEEALAIPALGGFLFDPIPFDPCDISNRDLLAALRALGFFEDERGNRVAVNFHLGSEELGSVYESLLELSPILDVSARTFAFGVLAGNERKTTGAYYTPEILVKSLLESALDPLIEAALRGLEGGSAPSHRRQALYALPAGIEVGGRSDPLWALPISPSLEVGRPASNSQSRPENARAAQSQSVLPTSREGEMGNAQRGSDSKASEMGVAQRGSALPPNSVSTTSQPKPTSPEAALLSISILDPACGSGHFLTAAARRIAHHLAIVRAKGDEPTTPQKRTALRDVVARCVYGVDLNPMAVELCKVALWMEALEPGRPLSFLDSHIRCGNALLGTTPELLEAGVPDDAYKPLEGDDRRTVASLKKRNAAERKAIEGRALTGMLRFDDGSPDEDEWTRGFAGLESAPDDTLDQVRDKEARFARLQSEATYRAERLRADAWCSAFVWRRVKDTDAGFIEPITNDDLHSVQETGTLPFAAQEAEVGRLSALYNWFHPHLEFPLVRERGGFDLVIGNPPWERVKLQEKEWFAARKPEVALAPNANARKRMIDDLLGTDAQLHADFLDARRRAEGESHFARSSGRFPLCGVGDVNTYALFAELNRGSIGPRGRVGCIVPSGIATDDTTKNFFAALCDQKQLVSLFDIENKGKRFFPDVHASFKFCLLTLSGAATPTEAAQFVFFAHSEADLSDETCRFSLSPEDIALLNPNTRTCPIFRSAADAELTKAIYRRVPVLVNEADVAGNAWKIQFGRMLHASDDSRLFKAKANGLLPLYEGKCFWQFDHRHATFEEGANGDYRDVTDAEKKSPDFSITTENYFAPSELPDKYKSKLSRWYLLFRNVTNSTNERTFAASFAPKGSFLHSANMITVDEVWMACCLCAQLNSFVFDYVCGQKMGGANITHGIFNQLPVLPPSIYEGARPWTAEQTLRDWVCERVVELCYTARDLEPFARDCGVTGEPFAWNPARRFELRCQLDAAFFALYGLGREEAAYVLDTFPIARRKDEANWGEYRTKRRVLELLEEMG